MDITELHIPDSVTYIGDSFNSIDVKEVVIPDSVTTIGSITFSYCGNLVSVTIPASVTEMGSSSMFNEHSEALVIRVESGSYAEQWCRENGMKYEVISMNNSPATAARSSGGTASAQPGTSTPWSIFMADFASHTDKLEETFTVACSGELQEQLFQNSRVDGEPYLAIIMTNEGMIDCSYGRHADSIEFVNCRYYEGKRIVQAWKTGKVSALTSQEQRTLEKAQQMVAGISGSELEREKNIHDLLCRHVNYLKMGSEGHNPEDSAVSAILNGHADCSGYSDAFYLLGSLAGLQVRYQHGMIIPDKGGANSETIGHMWNLVNIRGKWVMLDVTLDDQENTQYFYFNIGTDYMGKDHRWDTESMPVPVEKNPSNNFRPAGLEWAYVDNWQDLQLVLTNKLGKQERLCLRAPASFNLKQQFEQVDSILQTLGVSRISYVFGPDCMEIFNVTR